MQREVSKQQSHKIYHKLEWKGFLAVSGDGDGQERVLSYFPIIKKDRVFDLNLSSYITVINLMIY